MRRPLPSLLALALTAVLLAACGDSDDQADETTSTTAPVATSAPATTAPSSDGTDTTGSPTGDAFVDQLVALGFEEDEATCLAGELLEGGLDVTALAQIAEDPGLVLAAVEACDISLTRILELAQALQGGISEGTDGGTSGATSLEEAFIEGFVESVGGTGDVSADEARCIAEELLAQGGDVTGAAELATDLESLGPVLEGCGVSASDIAG